MRARVAPGRGFIAIVMALGSGLLIGSVAFELIDDAIKTQTVGWVGLGVLVGAATFTAGDEEVEVAGGHLVVVPPNTPHKLVNTGDGKLRMVTIHTNGTMVQEDLD